MLLPGARPLFKKQENSMATLAAAPPLQSPIASQADGQTLKNVLYEKKGGIAYVTLNRPK